MPRCTTSWRVTWTGAPTVDCAARAPARRARAHRGSRHRVDLPYLLPGLEVTAGDLSAPMIRQAEAQAHELEIDVTCRVMDAHALDVPDASFNVVLLHLILAVVPDPHAAFREAERGLRSGGRVEIFDKFVPSGAVPSLPRRLAGVVANVLFSDINRQLELLLHEAGLEVEHDEPSIGRGLFRAVIARKLNLEAFPSINMH